MNVSNNNKERTKRMDNKNQTKEKFKLNGQIKCNKFSAFTWKIDSFHFCMGEKSIWNNQRHGGEV